jgi:DNA-binding NtrC family response regulator
MFYSPNGRGSFGKLKTEKNRTQFIFLDLNMPRVSGQDCLKELKKVPYLSDIPVIIFTTSRSEKEMQQVYSMGAYSFLQKPPTMDALVKSVKKIIEA